MTLIPDSTAPVRLAPDRGFVPPWVPLSSPTQRITHEPPLRRGRILSQIIAGSLLVFAVVGVAGSFSAKNLAELQAVNDAARIAQVLALAVVQPSLNDAMMSGDPAALAAFDDIVRKRVLVLGIVRVKLWKPDGTILYADEPQLMGQRFALGAEQLEVLAHPQTKAEVSDLSRSENEFEKADRLLEVYRPVWTPANAELLFETYSPYDPVQKRADELWRGFAGVTLSSLLVFVVLLTPILWHLMSRLRRASEQRERLLERAVDASSQERKRIAATLHDGPVQELAATSFAVSGTAERADAAGRTDLGDELRQLSGTVRSSMRALRSLLVDIYPPSLEGAGLAAALTDLAQTAEGREVTIHTDVAGADDLGLDRDEQRLVHRVAQECLRNVAKHAAPCTATLSLREEGRHVVLDVIDDGPGFDAAGLVRSPREAHFGLRVLSDLAEQGGALLKVASAPGQGTHWRMVLATPEPGPHR